MRKFKCIKSYESGEYLTKGKIYTEDNCKFIYDDGWTNNWWDYNSSYFDKNDAMSNYLEAFDEEMKSTKKYDLKKENVAVLCDTKDKIREIYKIYGGHPSKDIFACYNPSKLYIAWDDDENELTWDSLSGYFEQHDYKLITFEEFKRGEEMKFKVGDMIKCIQGVGEVYGIDKDGDYAVHLNKKIDGHNCNISPDINEIAISKYNGDSNSMWYNERQLESVSLSNNQKSIHITFSENSTHAVLKDGKDVIKQSTVGLYHKDEYKFEVGVMEVVKKLLDIKDDAEEKCECGEETKFDWDNFKNNQEVAVIIHSEEEAKLFVSDCYEHGIKWASSSKNETHWDMNNNGMLGYSFSWGTLGHCDIKWYKNKGYKIVNYKQDNELIILSDYSTDELLSEIKLRMEK